MSTKSDEYEEFVSNLIKKIKDNHRRIGEISFGRRNEIIGVSGVYHQVDVSFVDYDFDNPTLVLIECKQLGRPIDLEHVKVLEATRNDIDQIHDKQWKTTKAIMITTIGARIGPQEYARYYDISIEVIPDSKNYSFFYENILLLGKVISTGKLSLKLKPTFLVRCKKCGKQFEQIDEEKICPICKAESLK